MKHECNRCGRELRTEALMISHLRWVHGLDLPQGIEDMYDGGFEKIKEELMKYLENSDQTDNFKN